jgi:hypothetical protein
MTRLVRDATPSHDDLPRADDRSNRVALYVFVALIVVALPLLLYLGHDRWFSFDEWAFLAARDGGDLGELFRPHAVHWSTLPVLWYRAMWNVFGIRTYLPYQVGIVSLHLTAAVLLRIIMRRARVNGWIATAAASLFVLFGTGSANIVWGFQVNEVGSLVFGLTHLLLADHDGPVDRRDGFGLLAGLAALMCSGFGVAMVGVVGIATLVRRGWRVALLHTGPLAAAYLLWLATSAWDDYSEQDRAPIGVLVRFVTTGVSHGFDSMGQVAGVGVVFAIVLVVGLWLAWSPLRGAELRRRLSVPAAMLAGALALFVLAALQRAAASGSDHARQSYYTHLFVAMVLPATAIAADALARRWRVLTIPVIALFIVGIPGNLQAFDQDPANKAFLDSWREYMLNVPLTSGVEEFPRTARPEPVFAPWVTVGWLLDGVAQGRVPKPESVDDVHQANALVRLGLVPGVVRPRRDCWPLRGPADVQLQRGQAINLNGGMTVVGAYRTVRSSPIMFAKGRAQLPVVAQLPFTARLTPIDLANPPALCA